MRAGLLRHRVTIQDKTAVQDGYGEETLTWSTYAERWASVEPLQGREFLEGKALAAEVTVRIRLRFVSGAAPEMRVVYGEHTYEIVSVIDVDLRGVEMVLMCREIV